MTDLVQGFRELADWLDTHEDLIPPFGIGEPVVNVVCDKDELVAVARSGGHWEKKTTGSFFYLRRQFGPVALDFFTAREQVCKRVVVDTIEHPETTVPARVEEVVEWVCDEPLLAVADKVSA